MSPFVVADNGARLPLRKQKLPYPIHPSSIESRTELKVGLAIYQAIGRVATALEHAVLDGVRLKGHEDDRDLAADEKADRPGACSDIDEHGLVPSNDVVDALLRAREVVRGLEEVLGSVVEHLSDGVGHDSSPSVGAPEGAGCGDSEPTGGDPHAGGRVSLASSAGSPFVRPVSPQPISIYWSSNLRRILGFVCGVCGRRPMLTPDFHRAVVHHIDVCPGPPAAPA